MVWNTMCWIMGIISIVGPICLIFWYLQGAKAQLARLNKEE
jgi:hypothetical protein